MCAPLINRCKCQYCFELEKETPATNIHLVDRDNINHYSMSAGQRSTFFPSKGKSLFPSEATVMFLLGKISNNNCLNCV